MGTHNFSFSGGEILTKMGATWFVSYAYYQRIDKNHLNWRKVATVSSRTMNYERGRQFHRIWLQLVLEMDEEKLNKNTIGLTAKQTKAMAREILDRWNLL